MSRQILASRSPQIDKIFLLLFTQPQRVLSKHYLWDSSRGSAMGFGNRNAAAPRISADRLAGIAGGGGGSAAAAAVEVSPVVSGPRARVSIEPDLTRIKARSVDETPEAQERRLAAKTVNFTATIIARLIILAALGKFGYDLWLSTGTFHRGVAVGLFAMLADLGRVSIKAMEPGTK